MIDLSTISDKRAAYALLAVYEMVDGFEEFCEWLDLDPTEPASVELFDSVHANYVYVWVDLGNEEFERQMRLHRGLL